MSAAETRHTIAQQSFLGLCNVLMQLRKVCNHPNLFESPPVLSPFSSYVHVEFTIPAIALDILANHPVHSIATWNGARLIGGWRGKLMIGEVMNAGQQAMLWMNERLKKFKGRGRKWRKRKKLLNLLGGVEKSENSGITSQLSNRFKALQPDDMLEYVGEMQLVRDGARTYGTRRTIRNSPKFNRTSITRALVLGMPNFYIPLVNEWTVSAYNQFGLYLAGESYIGSDLNRGRYNNCKKNIYFFFNIFFFSNVDIAFHLEQRKLYDGWLKSLKNIYKTLVVEGWYMKQIVLF
jgi:hypothetical protein